MSKIYTRVNRVADWSGWCSPCEREDRPLVLTRSGPGGVGAWLAGLGDDDRLLLLTCRVCGNWQFVPAREEDDPEVIVVEDDVLEAVAGIVGDAVYDVTPAAAVYDVRATGRSVQLNVGAPPRLPTIAEQAAAAAAEAAQAAVEPITVESLIAALGDVPTGHEPVALASPDPDPYVSTDPEVQDVEAAVEAPAAVVVPEPRAAVERIVTVPDAEEVTAFSQEAVAAAAAVLSAARAETVEPSNRRGETVERRHRARRGPTPRRSSDRVAAVRAAAAAEAAQAADAVSPPAELVPVLGLPAGTRQVVLAAAS